MGNHCFPRTPLWVALAPVVLDPSFSQPVDPALEGSLLSLGEQQTLEPSVKRQQRGTSGGGVEGLPKAGEEQPAADLQQQQPQQQQQRQQLHPLRGVRTLLLGLLMASCVLHYISSFDEESRTNEYLSVKKSEKRILLDVAFAKGDELIGRLLPSRVYGVSSATFFVVALCLCYSDVFELLASIYRRTRETAAAPAAASAISAAQAPLPPLRGFVFLLMAAVVFSANLKGASSFALGCNDKELFWLPTGFGTLATGLTLFLGSFLQRERHYKGPCECWLKQQKQQHLLLLLLPRGIHSQQRKQRRQQQQQKQKQQNLRKRLNQQEQQQKHKEKQQQTPLKSLKRRKQQQQGPHEQVSLLQQQQQQVEALAARAQAAAEKPAPAGARAAKPEAQEQQQNKASQPQQQQEPQQQQQQEPQQ
ncbi:hypothetical protein Esti_002857 [Eimeria stiedai]